MLLCLPSQRHIEDKGQFGLLVLTELPNFCQAENPRKAEAGMRGYGKITESWITMKKE
jgi:hypothetical protein